MNTTHIRLAEAGDVDVVDQLLGQLADALGERHAYRSDPATLRRHGFGERRLFRALLAECDATAVGLCTYFPEFSTWRGQAGVYVQDLVVSEATRGDGVGRRMLASAMSDGSLSWGARYLRLAVGVDNQSGIDFYRRLGMVIDDDNRAMILTGDAVADLVAGAE